LWYYIGGSFYISSYHKIEQKKMDKKTWVERVGKERTAPNENDNRELKKSISDIKPAPTTTKTWAEKVGKKPPVKTPSTPTAPTKGKGISK
jgi:hypothetical protein